MKQVHIEYDIRMENDLGKHLNKVAIVVQLDQELLLPEDRSIIFSSSCASIRMSLNNEYNIYPKIVNWDVINKTATLVITLTEVLPIEKFDMKLYISCKSDKYVDTLLDRQRYITI